LFGSHAVVARQQPGTRGEKSFHGADNAGNPAAMPFPFWLPALLGILSAVGPVSTDMYLPAFPAIEA